MNERAPLSCRIRFSPKICAICTYIHVEENPVLVSSASSASSSSTIRHETHSRAEPKLLAYAYSAIAPRAIAPSMPTIAVARAPAPELVWDPSVLVWLGLEDEAVRVEVMDATRSRTNVSIGTRDWNL